MTIILMIHNQ